MSDNHKNEIITTARLNLEKTAARLNLDGKIVSKLANPKEQIKIRLNPVVNNGKPLSCDAFIVRFSDVLGPAKGGIRMTPSVTMDEITGLAMEMTWKTSLISVPFGGGKSGICYDPARLSQEDKERIVRSFAICAKRHIGPEIYIPAPDMGTNEKDMGHICDCVSHLDGISITRGCSVTGKPVILGGILGRREATGKGVVYTVQAVCSKLGLDIRQLRVAIQGFGNVGSVVGLELMALGAKIVAVADLSGAILNETGIDIQKLYHHVQHSGCVKGFKEAKAIHGDEIFGLPCDCFIPAAAASQITAANASKIQAKIIAEAANAPTVPGADEVLNNKGICVIPDILCNAGGVFVSYLEYVQETQREQWTLEQVNSRLKDRMLKCFDRVWNYSIENGITLREASMDIAVNRIVQGMEARGLLWEPLMM